MNADPMSISSADSAGGDGSECAARRSIGWSRANVTAATNAFGDALLGVDGGLDGVGHRGQEPLRFPPDQRRDQIVAARIAPVGGHPGDAGPAHHVFDGDALQPDGCRLLQRGIQQPLAGAVGGFVDPASRPGAADDDDELGVDHRATTSGTGTPAALARASSTYRGVPNAHRCRRASSCSAGS